MTEKDKVRQVYGDASWMKAMEGLGPNEANAFSHMAGSILEEGALPSKIKHFILFATYVSKGNENFAMLHAEKAKETGATAGEWNEILLTAILSRGPMMYAEGSRILGLVHAASAESEEACAAAPPESSSEILRKFEKDFGGGATWLQLLGKNFPKILEGYFWLRSGVMTDGVLPRKYKELLLVGLNAAERYHTGMEVHAKFALNSGASKEELQEAMATSILGGGMPSWLEASGIYEKVVAEIEA